MKIIVIGATGTIGNAVATTLEAGNHEVIRASRSGPVRADLSDVNTLDALFATTGPVDAVVCAAAHAPLTPLGELTDADFTQTKLHGQLALFQRALKHLRDNGSITLTGGRFDGPMPGGAVGAMVNAGLEAFVRTAAPELPRGIRATVISPGWIAETLTALGMDPANGTPAATVAQSYVDAVMPGRD